VADHGSYFVTTYNRSKQYVEEEKKKNKLRRKPKRTNRAKDKRKKKNTKEIIYVFSKSIWRDRKRMINKRKSF